MPVKKATKLTSKGVRLVMNTAIAKAAEFGIAVTVAIVDAGGHMLVLERMDGGRFHTVHSSTTKAVTAASNKRPTTTKGAQGQELDTLHAIGLSLAGMTMAMVVSGGFSGSLHALWGLGTILFGCVQIISGWFRGSHGGKYGADSDPDDPATWHGDHFDMTPQRRWFESYHKTAGYFTLFLALGAVVSGLTQFWVPVIAIFMVVLFLILLLLVVVLEGKGFRQDTYRSVYGSHPDNPYNKARQGL